MRWLAGASDTSRCDVVQRPGVGAARGRSHAQQVKVVDTIRHPRRVEADDLEVLSHLRHDPVPPANRFHDVGEQDAPEKEGDDEVGRPEDGDEQQERDDGDQDDVARPGRFHGTPTIAGKAVATCNRNSGSPDRNWSASSRSPFRWLNQVSSSDFSCISSRSATDADVK